MYYEEKIINDVLCTRGTPDGEFIPLSQVALTSRIVALRAEQDEAITLLEDLNLWLIRSNLGGTAHQRGIALFLARAKTNESIRDSSEPVQND